METDLERAKALLGVGGNTCVLVRGGLVHSSQKTGIAPMVDFLQAGTALRGFSAADTIVGKAAALLFALAGVRAVYGTVMSRPAVAVLTAHGIAHSCATLTDNIINRAGTGLCPMETAVQNINDPAAALLQVQCIMHKA